MDIQRKYAILYRGLSEGEHRYKFSLNRKFFENFGYHEFGDVSLEINACLNKKSRVSDLQISISGSVMVECDRCLDFFSLPVTCSETLIIKTGEQPQDAQDHEIFLAEEENHLDLSQLFYEFVLLALPLRKVHPDKDGKIACNQEMVKKLEIIASDNQKPSDPRWSELEKIRNRLNNS